MRRCSSIILILALVISTTCIAGETKKHPEDTGKGFVPRNGFVPDEQTAIRIAEAIWIPIYGKEKIEAEKPFLATLRNGVWLVVGTFHSKKTGMKGGVAEAEISKMDGRILRVSHGK